MFITDRARGLRFRRPAAGTSGAGAASYERAEALFREGRCVPGRAATLDSCGTRRSPTTPSGASAPMLMTKSGHASIRTRKYARPSTEALAKWQQETDRTRRGGLTGRRYGVETT